MLKSHAVNAPGVNGHQEVGQNASVRFVSYLIPIMLIAITLIVGTFVWLSPFMESRHVEDWEKVGALLPRIDESSGLAPSFNFPDCFWTHNDNGGEAGLFLIDGAGALRAKVNLKDVPFVDWEAMSSFQIEGRNYLLLGDVGDNRWQRERVRLFLFEEPVFALAENAVVVELAPLLTTEFEYDDGPHDCEAIAVDTEQRQVWLISKIVPWEVRPSQPGL